MTFDQRLLSAIRLATQAHHGQTRKGAGAGTPYIVHPLRVAESVARVTLAPGIPREDVILAAVLHDTLEDTDVTAEQLEAQFGHRVLSIVKELTQDASLPKDERRKHMIAHCATMSPTAKVVKLADRLDNLREMASMDEAFQTRYRDEGRQMLANMKGACPELEAQIQELLTH